MSNCVEYAFVESACETCEFSKEAWMRNFRVANDPNQTSQEMTKQKDSHKAEKKDSQAKTQQSKDMAKQRHSRAKTAMQRHSQAEKDIAEQRNCKSTFCALRLVDFQQFFVFAISILPDFGFKLPALQTESPLRIFGSSTSIPSVCAGQVSRQVQHVASCGCREGNLENDRARGLLGFCLELAALAW